MLNGPSRLDSRVGISNLVTSAYPQFAGELMRCDHPLGPTMANAPVFECAPLVNTFNPVLHAHDFAWTMKKHF